MSNQKNELISIITKFAESGWEVIDTPSKEWLNQLDDNGIPHNNAELIKAIEIADRECGSCGCEFDPLYKRALVLLQ